MKELPQEIKQKIPNHLQVVWWGRRSALEVIPEWSIFFWRSAITFFLARWLLLAGLDFTPQFAIGVLLFWIIFALRVAVFEQTKWRREVYVVARDIVNDNSKGQVYRFTGSHVLQWSGSYSFINDPITASWPSVKLNIKQWESWWAKLTGRPISRVFLDNPSSRNVFIAGNLIDPAFIDAIWRIQGEVPSKYSMEDNETIATLRELREWVKDNLMDPAEARAYAHRYLS